MRKTLMILIAFLSGSRIAPQASQQAFAVVELFTSEGCSSCPPADRLLSELSEEADHSGQPVYLLSFHVDYWNYLGWADPFSREEFSKRQEKYARALGGRVYTPQMIVNGADEFVGSEARTARRRLDDALQPDRKGKRDQGVMVSLEPKSGPDERSLDVTYKVSGHAAGTLLNLAVVEKGLSVPVRNGENGGRTLRHDNVVRAFATVRLDARGEGHSLIRIPAAVKTGAASLIAYAQDAESLRILGAAKVSLPTGMK
jgi:hypothetical protein